ncbi:hypothetical protein [Legionella hackeliae]|uniref:hypothetical protein n=1 Tax=Legionella hackeliae TaxID=449 RepID=UPI00155858C6|nr:hypothetical protein [Legionella hackeliae]
MVERSEAINLLTGDQSFSEALSLSKIIFYQTMGWKKKFYDSLIKISQKYRTLHQWLIMVGDSTTPIKSLANFLRANKEILLIETEALRNDLQLNKNIAVMFLNFLHQFLTSTLYERFTHFIDHMKQHLEFYADEKRSEETDFCLSREALIEHVDTYFKHATTSDKNKMLHYLSAQMDSLIKLNEYEIIWFYIKLKLLNPDLEIPLTVHSIINFLAGLPPLHVEVCGSNGQPISLPPATTRGPTQTIDEEKQVLYETMTNLRLAIMPLEIVDLSRFTCQDKIEILNQLMLNEALCYNSNVDVVIKFLENETNPQLFRKILKLLFTIPSYIALEEGVRFDANKPSLFFQIKKEHPELVEILFTNPKNVEVLCEELFLGDSYTVKADNTTINELVLNALLFPEQPGRRVSIFFKSPGPNDLKEQEVLRKILNTGEKEIAIQNLLLTKNTHEIAEFTERWGDYLPVSLKKFLSENMDKPRL